jgi:hypothetical protein
MQEREALVRAGNGRRWRGSTTDATVGVRPLLRRRGRLPAVSGAVGRGCRARMCALCVPADA